MTTVTLKDKAANVQELSSHELDWVIGGGGGKGAPAGGTDHNGAIPVLMGIAAALPIVGGMIAGIIGSFVRGEE
jgi:hypothetical protein